MWHTWGYFTTANQAMPNERSHVQTCHKAVEGPNYSRHDQSF